MAIHDEEWEAWPGGEVHVVNGTAQNIEAGTRAKLIAQAPAMARLLLALQWQGVEDFVGDGGYHCCPSCRGVAPENEDLPDAVSDIEKGRTVIGHKADCELAAVLRQAGVLT